MRPKATSPKMSPKEDPWLRHLERWEVRLIRFGVFCGLVIFILKLLFHELGLTSLRTEAVSASTALPTPTDP